MVVGLSQVCPAGGGTDIVRMLCRQGVNIKARAGGGEGVSERHTSLPDACDYRLVFASMLATIQPSVLSTPTSPVTMAASSSKAESQPRLFHSVNQYLLPCDDEEGER